MSRTVPQRARPFCSLAWVLFETKASWLHVQATTAHKRMYMYMYMYTHMKMFMTFHNGFMFLLLIVVFKHFSSFKATFHNNIRIGIVWVQRGHSTGTCTATLCVIETRTHQKFESFKKKTQRRNSNPNLLINSKTPEIVRIHFGRIAFCQRPIPWTLLQR